MIRQERDGDIAQIVLDRADRRNALTPEMLEHLALAGQEAAQGGAGCILVAGDGKVFCAGFDLDLCRGSSDGGVMRGLLTRLSATIVALRALPIPVVVAAHGAAIAGGCALLGGADVVITDRGAKLGYPVVRLGVSPAVSAPFLRLAVGGGRARAGMLDPGLISGEEAGRIGLAHVVVEGPEQVRAEGVRIARDLAGKPRAGVEATKRWLNEIAAADPERALETSLSLAGGSEEAERLAAMWKAQR
jgi:enoyl-CoA hydratase/carnithine racemase